VQKEWTVFNEFGVLMQILGEHWRRERHSVPRNTKIGRHGRWNRWRQPRAQKSWTRPAFLHAQDPKPT